MQQGRDIGAQKSQYAAGQMKTMHRSKNVNKGAAGAAGKVETTGGKLAPNEKLPGEKHKTQNSSQGEPGEMAFVAERTPGIDCTGASAASRVISRRAKLIVMLLTTRTPVLASNNIQGNRTGTHVRM